MAVAAGHDGVDEIIAALDRGFGMCAAHEQDTRQGARKKAIPQHDFPQIPGTLCHVIADAANGAAIEKRRDC
jgi:hypothetical protein